MKSLIKNIKHKLNLCYSIIGLINPRCNINEIELFTNFDSTGNLRMVYVYVRELKSKK